MLGDIDTKGDFSEATSREIDLEVRRIMNDCYMETEQLLRSHNRLIHELAEVLLINETVDAEEMEIVMQCYTNSNNSSDDDQQEKTNVINAKNTIASKQEPRA
jgi:cell division protease FtsH